MATKKTKAFLFLFSAYSQINNKANVVTSPKENIPTPALVYLDSCTLLKSCTVCCCFPLSLNQYLCISTSFAVGFVCLFVLLSNDRGRKLYIVLLLFSFHEIVVKPCASNMRLLISLWNIMLLSVRSWNSCMLAWNHSRMCFGYS